MCSGWPAGAKAGGRAREIGAPGSSGNASKFFPAGEGEGGGKKQSVTAVNRRGAAAQT
jgi:hypothetical protein